MSVPAGPFDAAQTVVSKPVQRVAQSGGVVGHRGMETVHLVTVKGPLFPDMVATLHALARRGFGAAGSDVAVQTRASPPHIVLVT